MLRFITTTTPKCTGSMPAALAIGASSGVRIRMAETVSSTMPTASSSMLTASRSAHGSSAIALTAPTSAGPIPLTVSSHE